MTKTRTAGRAGTAPVPTALPSSGALLTRQEAAVTKLVSLGLSNKETALRLDISVKTVEYHLSHAYAKLHVRTRTELARHLMQEDWYSA